MTTRILIADDDDFLTQMYRLTLDAPDRVLEIVHDGEAALWAVETNKPTILLLDLLMPKMDGFTVLERLKKKGYTFPIVILSNVQPAERARCLELGATDFYNKNSTDLEGLSAIIQRHLSIA